MFVIYVMCVVYNVFFVVGIYGFFVEVLNDKVKVFYKSLGFIQLVGNNECFLFYFIKFIEKLFEE